ncbi:MAG: major facilitator superfamily protein [Frankiales bacterium]|nr:major facilitator superfamily protein [Frankiales bacterium]
MSALRVPAFRWLYAGQAVSAVGDQVFPVTVAVLVLDSGGTAGELGLVLAARFAALVLFSLLGGVWADRLPRRRVMLSADVLRLVAVLGLVAVGTASVPVLAALVFLVGAGEAFFRPAFGALLPSVLPAPLLPSGNALASSTHQLAQVVGPGLAGLLVAAAGVRAGFLFDASTFALSALTLLRVHEEPHVPGPRSHLLAEVTEGVRAVLARPWIAACLLMFSVNMLAVAAPVQVLLPVTVRDTTGETATYGVVLALGAVGGLLGAFVATRLPAATRGRAAVLATTLYAAEPVALLLEAPLPLLCVAWAVGAAGIGLFIVAWESSLQADVPRALLARVVSLDWMMSFALYPLGLALVGPVVDAVGRRPLLVTSAVLALALPPLVLRVPGVTAFRTAAPAAAPGTTASATTASATTASGPG